MTIMQISGMCDFVVGVQLRKYLKKMTHPRRLWCCVLALFSVQLVFDTSFYSAYISSI